MRPLMTTAVPIGVTSMRPLYSLALYANQPDPMRVSEMLVVLYYGFIAGSDVVQ